MCLHAIAYVKPVGTGSQRDFPYHAFRVRTRCNQDDVPIMQATQDSSAVTCDLCQAALAGEVREHLDPPVVDVQAALAKVRQVDVMLSITAGE